MGDVTRSGCSRILRLAICVSLLIAAPGSTAGGVAIAPPSMRAASEGRPLGRSVPGGTRSVRVYDSRGNGRGHEFGPMDERSVIVLLRRAALADTLRRHPRNARGARVRARGGRLPMEVRAAHERLLLDHARFRRSLGRLTARLERSHPGVSVSTRLRREYLRVVNGVALRAPQAVIEALRGETDVLAVHEDTPVRAALEDYPPMTGAAKAGTPILRSQGATGAGVVVGIIDTGIDYDHPDLGGGFGAGFKVIGGYDFVNDDCDPMDDAFHGTHVAGIVAADGALKGVAPDAKLFAYKVLNESDLGLASDVIAAIEASADPDGDPSTDDALDIINLSLGGSGDPDDPMSRAIDGAFDAGVLPVVAAGNRASAFQAMMSPGCARKALTVGAVDKSDAIAPFSSRGPTPRTLALKPDLLAPGVAIRSTFPNGRHGSLQGTSMASAHVAGASALLLQRDPGLTPAGLRSVLMTSARSLGLGRFVQGAGRIDVAAAALVTTLADPPSISFGLADSRLPVFEAEATLTVTNRGPAPRAYAIGAAGDGFPDGLSATATPSTLALVPEESAEVLVTLSLDNARVPQVSAAPFAYTGVVQITAADGSGRVEVPFSVLKGPTLELGFDPAPLFVVVSGEESGAWSFLEPGSSIDLLTAERSLDVMALFYETTNGRGREHVVVRDGLPVDTPHLIRRSEATHRVTMRLRDERGEEVSNGPGLLWMLRPESDRVTLSGLTPFGDEIFFSDVAKGYRLDWRVQGGGRPPWRAHYTAFGQEHGVSSDLVLENESHAEKRPRGSTLEAPGERPGKRSRTLVPEGKVGGVDGTRTRDLRRDRPAF